jgi:hypothetical protein
MVPDIGLAPLNAQPQNAQRSESLQSFLNKSAIKPDVEDGKNFAIDSPTKKLQELSNRTGISVQTLRMVKKVERSVS